MGFGLWFADPSVEQGFRQYLLRRNVIYRRFLVLYGVALLASTAVLAGFRVHFHYALVAAVVMFLVAAWLLRRPRDFLWLDVCCSPNEWVGAFNTVGGGKWTCFSPGKKHFSGCWGQNFQLFPWSFFGLQSVFFFVCISENWSHPVPQQSKISCPRPISENFSYKKFKILYTLDNMFLVAAWLLRRPRDFLWLDCAAHQIKPPP